MATLQGTVALPGADMQRQSPRPSLHRQPPPSSGRKTAETGNSREVKIISFNIVFSITISVTGNLF